MQCVNCQFENMPGTRHCVRCGTSLQLASAVLSVQPPRAGAVGKRLRPWLPSSTRVHAELRDLFSDTSHIFCSRLGVDLPDAGVYPRMIIPGWAHSYAGHRRRGRFFFWGYLSTLLIGLVCFGSTLGGVLLGMAFSVHAASIIDLTMTTPGIAPRTAMLHGAAVILVMACAYWPIVQLTRSFVVARQLATSAGPFSAGDAVLMWRSASTHPRALPGDIVLYDLPGRDLPGRPGQGHVIYRLQGERIERVVAGPNSSIQWKDKTLRINGQPAPPPANPQNLPSELNLKTGPEQCCILLTTDPVLGPGTPEAVWRSVCVIRLADVRGRVFLRHYPFWRFWWVS